ncbi:hypothetical protein J7E71_23215 [Mesobacillus foraminis]|nr:hypothetical protein [Mesobacillus foraminis]
MKKYIIPVLTAMALAAGCSSTTEDQASNDEHSTGHHQEQAAPVLTYKVGSNDWSAITSLTDDAGILEAYQFAVAHPEVLNYMPCYCGCYEEDGHTSNTNCFVDKVEDNVATLDTMGFG